MTWNLLCKLTEKNKLKDVASLMSKAKLFVLEKFDNQWDLVWDYSCQHKLHDFRLPFPVIAIQDAYSLNIFADTKDDQFGVESKRIFLQINYGKRPGRGLEGMILLGDVYSPGQDSQDNEIITVETNKAYGFRDNKIVGSVYGGDCTEHMSESLAENIITSIENALHELNYMLQPKHFILEEKPSKISKQKIPRSHLRPVYTLLTPDKIRKKLMIPGNGNDTKRTSHERSGHYRTLKHERFGNNVGKRIWIKPTWIGPSEAKIGNKFYRVILDN